MVLSIGQVWAKELNTIAVLPFSVHSADNIDYVKSGIWDMLISRLSASSEINVTRKDAVKEMMKKTGKAELTIADVYGIGKTLDVDFVVWGSITKIGNSVSLDGKLLDVAAYKSPVGVFEQCQGLDEVIPKINEFAKKINYHLLGTVPPSISGTTAPVPPAAVPALGPQRPVRDTKAVEALRTPEGTYTAVINPDFIQGATPLNREGFWMSRKYPLQFKGMDVGDVNNDGLNEIITITQTEVVVYQKKGKDLNVLGRHSGESYDNYISVDVADINGNGVKEIIVTNVINAVLRSFVLEYQDKKLVAIASNLPWFLRVITTADNPLLIGQTIGIEKPFQNPIYEIVWENDGYEKGKRMLIPEELSVYGLTVDSIDGTVHERVIALDEFDHLKIIERTKKILSKIEVFGGSDELLWKSDEVFGGSNNHFEYGTQDAERSAEWADDKQTKTYVNVRILTYDLNKNGKREIVIVKNMAASGRYFKNVRAFTKSEIYDLEWDGLGFVQNWKTRKIQGYVADYQFKDYDNDGENEIVLAVVLASAGGLTKKSIVIAYDLAPH